MSASGSKADISACPRNVRFNPKRLTDDPLHDWLRRSVLLLT